MTQGVVEPKGALRTHPVAELLSCWQMAVELAGLIRPLLLRPAAPCLHLLSQWDESCVLVEVRHWAWPRHIALKQMALRWLALSASGGGGWLSASGGGGWLSASG